MLSTPDEGVTTVVRAGWAWIATPEGSALRRNVDIRVESSVIASIEASGTASVESNEVLLDATDCLVLPGFISGHTHVAAGSYTRGLIESGRTTARPHQIVEALDDDDLYALTAYNLAELLLSGCTTVLEMSHSLRRAELFAELANDWGVRAYVGGMVPGISRLRDVWSRTTLSELEQSVPQTMQEIQENIAFGDRLVSRRLELVEPMMSPHATDTHSAETLREVKAGAVRFSTPIHIHLSQNSKETAIVEAERGRTPSQWLDDLGLFEVGVFGAHLNGVVPEVDFPLLSARKFVYAHCPSGGGAGGRGQPWADALAAGVRTNIGIDTHSNDYVENLKLAVLFGQLRRSLQTASEDLAPREPSIEDALNAATVNPAWGLGRSDLGRLVEGARADLVAIDVSSFLVGSGALPPDPLLNLLYANGRFVRHVLIDGRLRVRNGELKVPGWEPLIRRGARVVESMYSQLAAEGWL